MALGASHATHMKRYSSYAKAQGDEARKLTHAAKKGQCKVALDHFANVAFFAGGAFENARGAVKRHRATIASDKQMRTSSRIKGFTKAREKVMAACHEAPAKRKK